MLRYLLCPLLTLTLVGCINAPIEGRADPFDRSQVHFATDELRRDTAVGTPIVTRDESNLLVVSVPVRSAVNQFLYVDYRVTFFDQSGTPIEHFGPFTKTLDPNTPDTIKVNSTSTRAADFQIDFRYAH